jgi:hypothetical protein
MLLCLGLIQFLQLTANEHNYGLQDDVNDDGVGNTATTDVAVAVDNEAAPLVMATMMATPKAIAVMVTMTILLKMAPANVTISWMMTTNDNDEDADNQDVGKDSLPPPMMATQQ